MACHFNPEEPVRDETIRIARELIQKAIGDIDNAHADVDEAVHNVRRRCKLSRALVRLVRLSFPRYRAENVWFRDLARTLSHTRDAAAVIESFDALTAHFGHLVHPSVFAPIRLRLEERRQEITVSHNLDAELEQARRRLYLTYWRIGDWRLQDEGFSALAGGLKKTYRRARRRMTDAQALPSAERLHEWRKRAKYHRYHLKLMSEAWPPVLGALEKETHRLTDFLGDDHDLAVLRQTLLSEPQRFGHPRIFRPLFGLIRWRRSELQKGAFPLGRRLFSQPPRLRIAYYEDLWQGRLLDAVPRPAESERPRLAVGAREEGLRRAV